MPILIEISIQAPVWFGVPGLEALAETALHAALEGFEAEIPEAAEISLLFCDDPCIQGLNKQWRGIDRPTNVLSFPSAGGLAENPLLGDIALSHATALREATAEGKSLADHVSHLLVHGCLHLLGFDHEDETEAEEMETLEREILRRINIDDPYRIGCAEAAG